MVSHKILHNTLYLKTFVYEISFYYGGPCSVNNGLALCSLHHAAFDMGAIAIDDGMKLLVSQGVNGNSIVERLFWDFAGKEIGLPKNKSDYPSDGYIHWHSREVFRG